MPMTRTIVFRKLVVTALCAAALAYPSAPTDAAADATSFEHAAGITDQYDLVVATRWVREDDRLGVLAFEIVVHNQGSEPSGPFAISNRIPVGTRLIVASRGVVTSPSGTDLRWSFGADEQLAPGATRRLTVLVLVDDESRSPFVNAVQLTAASGVDDDDIATVYLHRVTGRVWVDLDRDARFEPDLAADGTGGERAGAGVAVVLRHRDGTLIEQQWTDHEGIYQFTMVPSGAYRLEIPADEFDAARPLAGHDWVHSPFRTGDFDPDSGIAIPLTLEPVDDGSGHHVAIGVADRPSDPWLSHIRLEWLVPGLVLAAAGLLLAQRRANRAIAVAG